MVNASLSRPESLMLDAEPEREGTTPFLTIFPSYITTADDLIYRLKYAFFSRPVPSKVIVSSSYPEPLTSFPLSDTLSFFSAAGASFEISVI